MNKVRHALDRDLLRLLMTKQWCNKEGLLDIGSHLYDYLDGLHTDLEEEGLPDEMAYNLLLKEILEVGMTSYGRIETSKIVSTQMAELLSDEDFSK